VHHLDVILTSKLFLRQSIRHLMCQYLSVKTTKFVTSRVEFCGLKLSFLSDFPHFQLKESNAVQDTGQWLVCSIQDSPFIPHNGPIIKEKTTKHTWNFLAIFHRAVNGKHNFRTLITVRNGLHKFTSSPDSNVFGLDEQNRGKTTCESDGDNVTLNGDTVTLNS
jgi:hypothetical protein